ncbi:uncharacterized protein [Temnothorax longispinosus]|uniref:uncharacterized protein n=1 Tax=Temnothorax longispinosus TaxID=300112 RepID=UPI003A9909D7
MREWQNSLTATELPSFKQLLDFIIHHSQMLESTGKSSVPSSKNNAREQNFSGRQVLCVGQVKTSTNHPTLQKTRFGWILAGRLGQPSKATKHIQSFHASVTNAQLDEQLSRFWAIETIEGPDNLTADEVRCEQHFQDNTTRTAQGRYIVKLLFKEQVIEKIGDTMEIALKRLRGLEKRLVRDPNLRALYNQFLDEYLALGHMKQVEDTAQDDKGSFYLPHHAVFKTTAGATKIRVVFDALCKSTSGISLNDALLTGPVVQQDLLSILTRFRMFRYVLTEVKTYELTTVTYGTSSASYLATRCLKHLAELRHDKYPAGSIRVQRDFYMDDLLTGADSITEAREARDEVIALLREGGFESSKWLSSCPELLDHMHDSSDNVMTINEGRNSSILGIH